MQFIDLKKQQAIIRKNLDLMLKNVLDDGQYIMGKQVEELEADLSKFSGATYSIGCSNGTDAIMLALMALDIKPGDGVLTIPFTYIATLEAISILGAKPVLVDVYDSTFNMNPDIIEEKILNSENKIKAIMPVDLFGLPARYRLINELATKYNLKVIGDAAQSFGASIGSNKVGTLADITTTSFFPAKPLGCYGDGGAIFTENDKIAEKLKSLRIHGKGKDKYDNVAIGMNSRLDTLQAGVLIEKLKIFSNEISRRNEIAELYRLLLKDMPIKFQTIPQNYKSVYAQFSILFESKDVRNSVQNHLLKHNIPSVIYYPIPAHLQTGYRYLNYNKGSFPVSENLSDRILSLPMHPYLSNEDISEIVNVIKNYFGA